MKLTLPTKKESVRILFQSFITAVFLFGLLQGYILYLKHLQQDKATKALLAVALAPLSSVTLKTDVTPQGDLFVDVTIAGQTKRVVRHGVCSIYYNGL